MFSPPEGITWLAVFAVESVVIVTVNLISVILFTKNRSLRTRSLYLVLNLTVADMLVGLFSGSVQQFTTLLACNCVKVDYPLKVVWINILLFLLSYFFPLVSLTNIGVISLERMHATFRPIRHRVIKRWVYVVAIAFIWAFPGIVLATFLEGAAGKKWTNSFVWASFCCLCLFVICVSYTSILFKFRCATHPQRHCAASLKHRKLTVTLFVTTLVSLLLLLPYNIIIFAASTTDSLKTLSEVQVFRLESLLIVLHYANSLVNPILYTIRMPDFKKAFLSLCRRQRRVNDAISLYRY